MLRKLSENDYMLIYEYEKLLLGKCKTLDGYYFREPSSEQKEKNALLLLRYVVEHYLRWSPTKMRDSLTGEILEQWKLTTYMQHIQFPVEIDGTKIFWYYAHKLYPQAIPLSYQSLYLAQYKRILSGEVKRFPKKYFYEGNDFANKIAVCLKYAIENFLTPSSYEELYEFFGTSACLKFLREVKLLTPIRDTLQCPIVALWLAVGDEQRDDFLLNYYRFHSIYDEMKRLETDKRGAKRKKNIDSDSSKKDDIHVQPILPLIF